MAESHDVLHEPAWVRRSLVALAVLVMLALVVLPLAMVLAAAFAKGAGGWLAALREPDALSALQLTLFTAAIVLPINAVFGLFAAWALARFEFRGKQILLATQKNASDDDPSPDSIYEVGTLASVLQMLKLPDGTVKVLVEGLQR